MEDYDRVYLTPDEVNLLLELMPDWPLDLKKSRLFGLEVSSGVIICN